MKYAHFSPIKSENVTHVRHSMCSFLKTTHKKNEHTPMHFSDSTTRVFFLRQYQLNAMGTPHCTKVDKQERNENERIKTE